MTLLPKARDGLTRRGSGYLRWTMKTDELQQELSEPGAVELLKSGPLVRLAYTGHDGYPRVIPIGFFWSGEEVIVCTTTVAPKVRAIAAHPHVAMTIDTGDTPATARSLLLRGTADVTTVDGVAEEYLAAAAKTLDPADLDGFEQEVRRVYKQMARIAIRPEWARYYDFGAGRLPKTLATVLAG